MREDLEGVQSKSKYNPTLVHLLARDLSTSKRGQVLFRKGLELQLQGLTVRSKPLGFRLQGLYQPLDGLSLYLVYLALTNKPGVECT